MFDFFSQDLRAHVLKNLLDTEVSYVQSLQFLVSVGLLLSSA